MPQPHRLRVPGPAWLTAALVLTSLTGLLAQDVSWSRQFGTSRPDQANAVVALDGNVFVVGDVIGAMPGQTANGANDRNAFIRHYDPNGTERWTRQFDATTAVHDSATSVAAFSGGIYVAGWTAGALPGESKSGPNGNDNAFIRKYNLAGDAIWTRQFGTQSTVQALGVAADATGVYVAGSIDCCGSPFPNLAISSAGADAFLRKYDHEGMELWTRQFGTGGVERGTAVAVDATGVYVTGTTNGNMAGAPGGTDVFIQKFDKEGAAVWTRQFGTSTTDEANAIAVGPSGIYVGGRTVGGFEGKPNGLWDAMVAKFDSSGNIQWARQFGGNDNDNVQGLYVGLTYVLVTGAVDLPMHAQDAFYRLYDFEGGTAIHVVFGDGLNDVGYGVSADARGFYVAGTKNGAALGLTPVGDNDAFLLRIANPPLTPVPGARPGPAPGNPPVPTTPQAPGRGGGRGGRGQ